MNFSSVPQGRANCPEAICAGTQASRLRLGFFDFSIFRYCDISLFRYFVISIFRYFDISLYRRTFHLSTFNLLLLRYHRPYRVICRAGGCLRAAACEDMRLVGIAYRTVRRQVTRCYPAEQLIVCGVASRLALAVVGQ